MPEDCVFLKSRSNGNCYCVARGCSYCTLPPLDPYWTEAEQCPRFEAKDDGWKEAE